jgi:hypothetical protein
VKGFIAAIPAIVLFGCAPMTWTKPGATHDDFTKDRYSCMQQSQQRVSSAYVNQYGGSANDSVITNGNLFGACMNAQGWTLQKKASTEQLAAQTEVHDEAKAAVESVKNEELELCSREDLRPYYSKTPCMAEDTTLEQMADNSRITNVEKVAMNKARVELKRINKEMEDLIRQYDPHRAPSVTARREQAAGDQDKVALDFYEGRITRGEYNKRRQEIHNKLKEDLAASHQHS